MLFRNFPKNITPPKNIQKIKLPIISSNNVLCIMFATYLADTNPNTHDVVSNNSIKHFLL
jgi:hypothetical protein